jgi:hypothetical protein
VALRKGRGLAGFAARGDLPDAIVERRLRQKVLMTLEQPRALGALRAQTAPKRCHGTVRFV